MSSLPGSSDVTSDKSNEAFVYNGSKSIHINEISLVLGRQLAIEVKDVEELIQGDVGSQEKDSSVAHPECLTSHCPLREDTSISNSLCAFPSTYVDTPWDLDRTDIWVSSLDLEREDSELLKDREEEFDIFISDFPSPSLGAMGHLQIWSLGSRSLISGGQEEKFKNTTTDSDEPLYWPFNHNLYNGLDFENFLCPSPCKDARNIGIAGFPDSKLTRLRLHQNRLQVDRKDSQRIGRRITISPKPAAVTTEHETRVAGNGAQRSALMSSRLSRSFKTPSYQHPWNISKRRGRPQLKISVGKHGGSSTELLNQPLKELELHDSVFEGNSIEKIVGLNEFDGHEGINVDCEEQFILQSSPYRGLIPLKTIERVRGQC
uniref:Uncharacterized protein n=2 Tax=Musa acuminata subsp. malaccensis TaxID=214687 RepID=A0A804J5N1_MUSAM|nr:PREDICTED: uncharacterized protein LOC103985231 isoform X1 [Musa acuminata subsp. malaccensis]XP_009401148.1 PREDICTED: uncharacterized protein LOC103985231 isoform X1 [Musa acuminata subsp. malaccensis]XP_018681563.1 PREDICTED: uncharacterized protein LOC103985231 isoform X1 [Musa acuminata subsp. malaccensis]